MILQLLERHLYALLQLRIATLTLRRAVRIGDSSLIGHSC